MSYNSPWMRRLNGHKIVEMRQQVLVVFVSLCILVSFTSAGQTPFLRNKSITTKSQSSITVTDPEYIANSDHLPGTIIRSGQRHPPKSNSHPENEKSHLVSSSTTTASPSDENFDFNTADTCGGIVNIPLSFDRLTTFESLQFPEERLYPLICNWKIQVPNKNCGLARITMRVDGRSRLPDVGGCAKGYYRVYPFMKEAKICGRIGDVPPFQWYVDAQKPENVTVVMENIGLGDGKPEGLSFTLQGECVNDKTIRVNKENVRFSRRWINRLIEDFEAGEGPQVIIKTNGLNRQTTVTPVRTSTISTRKTSTTIRPAVSNDDNDNIPWLILQSPESSHSSDSSDSVYFRPSTTKTIRHPSSTTVRPSTTTTRSSTTIVRPSINYLNSNQDIPWLILKSPQQADDQHQSSYEIYPHNSQPNKNQNNNNVKQTTLSTKNPWLALKAAYLRNVSSSSKSTPSSYTQSYYSYDPKIINRSPVNTAIIQITTDLPSTKAEFVPTTDSPIMTTSLPTTATSQTTFVTETSTNPISYSTQEQWTTLNQNDFNSFPTVPASNEPPTTTSVVITSPAPITEEPSLDEDSPAENDANISYISLNGQKFIFSKLRRMFTRTYKKLMKIMS